MDESTLKDFVAVYQTQSMTKAAEQRFSQPSSLMRHINALEDELGCRLFIRKSSGCIPTQDGETLYRQVVPILRQLQGIHDLFQKNDAIRICMPVGCLLPLVDSFCSSYIKTHENAQFEYVTGPVSDWIKMISEGTADCALLTEDSVPLLEKAGLSYLPCGTRRMVCLLSKNHPLAGEQEISISMLRGHRVVIDDYTSLMRLLTAESISFRIREAEGTLSSLVNLCRKQAIVVTTSPFHTLFPALNTIPLREAPPIRCGFAYSRKRKPMMDFFSFCIGINAEI